MTLLDIQERLIANCGERFSVLVASSLERHRLTVSSHSKRLGRMSSTAFVATGSYPPTAVDPALRLNFCFGVAATFG
jgi:hypothetical protein